MGARQRRETFLRAVRRGESAFREGKSRDTNPYKYSPWGNGSAWDMGWLDAERADKAEGGTK